MSIVGSVGVRVVPSFSGMHRAIGREFSGSRGPVSQAASELGSHAGSAMATSISSRILGSNFTDSFRTSFGRAKSIAEGEGGIAGRSWAVRTASSISGESSQVAEAITQPFSGAMSDVVSVGNVTGLSFANATSSSIARDGSSIQDAVTSPFSGVMSDVISVGNSTGLSFSGAAASSIASGGATAGQGFMTSLGDSIGNSMGRISAGAEQHAINLGSVFGAGFVGKFTKMIGPLAGILSLGSILGAGFNRLADIDDAEQKFKGLGYSAEEVEAQMDSALSSVEGTTIGLNQAADASVGAAAAGVDMGDDMTAWLTAIGDATAQSNAEYGHMAQMMNRVQGAGKVMGSDLTQMSDNGFEAAAILSKELGVTTDEVREMATAGEISAAQFQEAIENQIGGSAQSVRDTIRGAVGEIAFQIGIMGAEFLESSGIIDLIRESANRFSSFLENTVTPAISNLFEWFERWGHIIRPIAAVIAGIVAGFVAFKVAATAIVFVPKLLGLIALGFTGIGRSIAAIPIIGWVAMAVGALVAFFQYTEVGQQIWEKVWSAIKTAVSVVVDWFTGTAMPAIVSAWHWVSGAFSSVWNGIIKPVWDALSSTVSWVWSNVVQPIFGFIQAAFRVLGTVFSWVWSNVIKPMWDMFVSMLRWVWSNVVQPIFNWIVSLFRSVGEGFVSVWNGLIKPVFDFFASVVRWLWDAIIKPYFNRYGEGFRSMGQWLSNVWNNVIRPMFRAFGDFVVSTYRNYIRPAFGWIRDRWDWLKNMLSSIWTDGIRPVFQRFTDFIQNQVVDRVKRGVDKIKDIWEGLKKAFAEPINWVIRNVVNKGLIGAFNKVAGFIPGVSKINEIKEIGAYAKGGLAPKGWALVGEEGPELVNFSQPGRVYTADQTRRMIGDRDEPLTDQELTAAAEGSRHQHFGIGAETRKRITGTAEETTQSFGDWVRGGLRKAAEKILDPIFKNLTEWLSGKGIVGDFAAGSAKAIKDKILSWATKDDESYEKELAEGGDYGGTFTANPGGFNRPASGPITSRAGRRGYFGRFGNMHYGVDIGGPIGSIVRAAWDGVVKRVYGGGLDKRMVVNHGKFDTSYLHNSAHLVGPGTKVKGGQQIAKMGTAGTGPHLHFELHPRGWYGPSVGGVNALFRDKGGLIYPGMNQVLNETGQAEYVFNRQQFDNLNRMAQRSNGTIGGDTYHVHGDLDQAYRMGQEIRFVKRSAARRQKAGV